MTNTQSPLKLVERFYALSKYAYLFPISISYRQGLFLHNLLKKHAPKKVLELGSGYGVSSVWIQTGITPSCTHIAIDPWASHIPEISEYLKQRNYSLIRTATSQEYLAKNCKKLTGSVDLFFVDADEHFDGCLTDCYFANRILKTNGQLIIRNCWNPAVRRVCQFMLKNLPYRLHGVPKWLNWLIINIRPIGMGWLLYHSTHHYTSGLCILEKTGPDDRPWDHFRGFC